MKAHTINLIHANSHPEGGTTEGSHFYSKKEIFQPCFFYHIVNSSTFLAI
jgi:hypothetical protein